MKRVFVVRHAQAIGKDANIPDLERTLTAKGVKDSRNTGKALARLSLQSPLLVSSPANRALETAQVVAREMGYHPEKILLKDAIYDSDDGMDLLNVVRAVDDGHDAALVFGHEPTLSVFAGRLVGSTIQALPKGAALGIDCDCDTWSTIGDKPGRVSVAEVPMTKVERARILKKMTRLIEKDIAEAISSAVNEHNNKAVGKMKRAVARASAEVAARLVKVSGDAGLIRQYLIQKAAEPADEPSEDKTDSQ